MEQELSQDRNEAQIKTLSDQLYSALMSKNDQGVSNLDMLYESICPEVPTKLSIFEYYNEYLLSNQSYITTGSPTAASLIFMQDVYNTFLSAVSHVKSLNIEQMNRMLLGADSLDGIDKDHVFEDTTLTYRYNSGTSDENTLKKIAQINDELDTMLANVEAQVAKDMAYILKLDKTYLYKANNTYISAYNTDDKTFGNVQVGYEIYFSPMNQAVAELFGFDINEYDFKVYNSGQVQLNEGHEKANSFKVETTEPFTLVVTYNQKDASGNPKLDKNGNPVVNPVYSTSFKVNQANTFGGGTGTTGDPYIIGTKEQFLMIRNTDRHKSYKLITDIDLGGMEISPFFNEVSSYEGTFNGNGYTIKNFTVKSQSDNASLFGIIGYSGKILNVKIENATITKEGNNDAKALYAGALASINNGVIYNVDIKNCTITASRDSKSNNGNVNNPISIKAGGLVGENNGVINYARVSNTKVSASSKRDYGANSDGSNQNVTYAGGVIGYSGSTSSLDYASIDVSSSVSSFIGCYMKEQLSYRYPKGTSFAAGICPVNDGKLMTNVYVAEKMSISATHDYKNDAWSGGAYGGGVDSKTGRIIYMGQYKKGSETAEKTVPSMNQYEAHLEAKGKIDTKYDICENLIFEPGTKSFNIIGLVIVLKNKTTGEETIIENPSIYSVKGFNSKNSSLTEAKSGAAIVVVLVPGFNTMFNFTLDYVIKPNSPEKNSVPIINGEINKFSYDSSAAVIQNANAHDTLGCDITVKLVDGTERNVNDIALVDRIDMTQYGKQTVNVSVTIAESTITKQIEVVIECDNHDFETTTVIEGHKKIDDKYYLNGYTSKECKICHYSEITPFDNMEVEVERVNYKASTCSEEGYTGDLIVKTTDTNKYVIEYGKSIELEKHTFVEDPADDKYHVCSVCNHKEEHLYYVVEDGSDLSNQLVYRCAVCGHTKIDAKTSREEIMSLPRVVVNDVYALMDSDNITVYITLHSSIGITSANFSIAFDERLTLLNYKYGNILGGGASIDSIKLYGNHINVVLAQSEPDTTTDGILLKLVFDALDNCNVGDIYKVGVVNKGTGDKFTDENGKKIDFVSYDGYVIIVDHLPGDINGDGKIDILDPILISNYIVLDDNEKADYITRMKEINDKFNMDYADINSDGRIDTDDIVGIMRYIVGEYEQQIVSSLYVVNLNYNDKSGIVVPYVVRCNTKYGDEITPGKENHLPVLEREGYKFDGWYTEIDGSGEKITDDSLVKYDINKYSQTLYAHYIMNEITFDSNGGFGTKPAISYSNGGNLDNLDNNNKPYITNSIYVQYLSNEEWFIDERNYDLVFAGWSLTPNGTPIDPATYALNSKGAAAFGNITLYAIWNGVAIEPIYTSRPGYEFKGWYTNTSGDDTYKFDKTIPLTNDMIIYAFFDPVTYTVSYDSNGGGGTMYSTINISYENTFNLAENKYSRTGYKFLGWATTKNGTKVYDDKQEVSKLTTATQNGLVVTLYAAWEPIKYTIHFDANITGSSPAEQMEDMVVSYDQGPVIECVFTNGSFSFRGWAKEPTRVNPDYYQGQPVGNLTTIENDIVTLYAIWG